MIPESFRKVLQDYKEGKIGEAQIEAHLRKLPFQDLGFAKVDHHRSLRHGFAEVIFGKGKSHEQIVGIAETILEHHPNLLITHTPREVYESLKQRFPVSSYYPDSRTLTVIREPRNDGAGTIGVFSAGTADIPVAEEALVTAQTLGNEVTACYDVGVAGLHRILSQVERLEQCSVIVCVAGMEGALPSVVGGLVDVPVIAVPTSVGYGASFNGLAALLGMLNSCSSNVTVVNIDNGFGAGYVASLINRKREFHSSTLDDEQG